ncbi:DegT/DnrJ/EryC1/StrS family aminotransferase [Cytobacillus sp. FJAT-53684]|uniref:DegT/DnrJ/EryC1/StrS family aminotransferase n=1 Tax=Cytobacillus mangrovibacter TaxID=3299024 RepID=A0ABW6JT47_9BACI
MIPLIDLRKQFQSIKEEILKETNKIIDSGTFILGPKVDQLEREIEKRLGVEHAITVANGTDALVLTLTAYGIGEGDEVITTPFTFFATAEAITRVGATPVFVDVDRTSFTIDPNKVAEKISSTTKAIIPVHLFGQPSDMTEIMLLAKENKLLVIEDACQAFGATYNGKNIGSIGDAACFSFFPTKNLGTMGDGGIITTSNHLVAEKIRMLRVHGSERKYFHKEIGYNSRLDEWHAAILLLCLKHIDKWNNQRGVLAERYRTKLKHCTSIKLPEARKDRSHTYHLFCLESPNREKIIKHLADHDIHTGIYYPCCLHLQEVYKYLRYQEGDLPIAEFLSKQLFAIPLHPFLSTEDQEKVIAALLDIEVTEKC